MDERNCAQRYFHRGPDVDIRFAVDIYPDIEALRKGRNVFLATSNYLDSFESSESAKGEVRLVYV